MIHIQLDVEIRLNAAEKVYYVRIALVTSKLRPSSPYLLVLRSAEISNIEQLCRESDASTSTTTSLQALY